MATDQLTMQFMRKFMSEAKALLSAEDFARIHKRAKASAGGQISRRGPKPGEADLDDAISKSTDLYISIIEKRADQQILTGVVLVPDVPDAHGDVVSADEIAKAHEQFMLNSQLVNLQHDRLTGDPERDELVKSSTDEDVGIFESYIAPADIEIGGQSVSKGSWVMSVKVFKSELWQAVKAGKFTGFSVQGTATRVPVA